MAHQIGFFARLRHIEHTYRWIDADGVSTRALVAGPSDAPPLILLHGIGGHLEAYIRNIAAHAEHFRTYAIDMVGHGFSDKPAIDYEIDAYVRHVLAVMDAEGIRSTHISGESLGGWVAARLASQHPDRVERIVLNTAGGRTFNPEVMDRIRTLSLGAVQDADWSTVRARLEWLMADPARVTDELIETRLAIYQQPGFLETMERLMCLQDPDIRRRNLLSDDDLRAIAAPTMVLWTTDDPSGAVTVGEEFAELIPDSELQVMHNCGHWPQWENAEDFDRRHISFLRS